MLGLDLDQFRLDVVRPSLQKLKLWAPNAENLVIGTCMTESLLKYLRQKGNGPAYGLPQMEPRTHDDIWANYLAYQPELRALLNSNGSDPTRLIWDLRYAVQMCRVHYRRAPNAIPEAKDAKGMAELWKRVYNTYLGAGTAEKALPYFRKACGE
jgi:hypothetical protein